MSTGTTRTNVYEPLGPQQFEPCDLATTIHDLILPFDETRFAQPSRARGICCSAKNVWYSNNHWPEDNRYASLFSNAQETQKMLLPELESLWNTISIRSSLRRKALASTPYTIELRMAGIRGNTERWINVRPSVWIRTTDEALDAKNPWKELKRLVTKLGLNSQQYSRIYAEGGLRLADDTVAVAQEHLDLSKGITFAGGLTLNTHIQVKPPRGSACGLPCLTTITKDNAILKQSLSRIGGLINHKSSQKGVTSGHVMLQYFLQADCDGKLSPVTEGDATTEEFSGLFPNLSDEDESDDEVELVKNKLVDKYSQPSVGHIDLAGPMLWHPLIPTDIINFVAQAEEHSVNDPTWIIRQSQPVPADFSLISGIDIFEHDNQFFDRSAENFHHHRALKQNRWVSRFVADKSLKSRDVLILIGSDPGSVIASIDTARIPLMIRGVIFWTLRLSVEAPLSPGTSGSWVIDKDSGALCGSVMVVFDQQPYALMTTAETLFYDIAKYSSRDPNSSTFPVISLPLEQKVQAETASEFRKMYIVNTPVYGEDSTTEELPISLQRPSDRAPMSYNISRLATRTLRNIEVVESYYQEDIGTGDAATAFREVVKGLPLIKSILQMVKAKCFRKPPEQVDKALEEMLQGCKQDSNKLKEVISTFFCESGSEDEKLTRCICSFGPDAKVEVLGQSIMVKVLSIAQNELGEEAKIQIEYIQRVIDALSRLSPSTPDSEGTSSLAHISWSHKDDRSTAHVARNTDVPAGIQSKRGSGSASYLIAR